MINSSQTKTSHDLNRWEILVSNEAVQNWSNFRNILGRHNENVGKMAAPNVRVLIPSLEEKLLNADTG